MKPSSPLRKSFHLAGEEGARMMGMGVHRETQLFPHWHRLL